MAFGLTVRKRPCVQVVFDGREKKRYTTIWIRNSKPAQGQLTRAVFVFSGNDIPRGKDEQENQDFVQGKKVQVSTLQAFVKHL